MTPDRTGQAGRGDREEDATLAQQSDELEAARARTGALRRQAEGFVREAHDDPALDAELGALSELQTEHPDKAAWWPAE